MNTAIAGVVILLSVLTYVAILVVGFLSFQKMRLKAKKIVDEAEEESKRVLELAKREAEELKSKAILESKEEANRYREEIEKDLRNIRRDLQAFERKLLSREENIERKESYLQRKERELAIKERELNDLQRKLEEEKERLMQELEKIAGMTKEDARNLLVESIKKETEISALNLVKKIEEEYNQKAVEKARKIIVDAIQRIALDVVNETVISSVQLPNDAMKGRIIGREGRNIRAFETITGVDLIIDDTPGVVVLSSFDPIRRELAKRALIKLVDDGRIHPATIEEVYEKVRNEFEEEIYKVGEETYNDLGLQPMSNEEYKYVGRLKFKVSYSQNVLSHSIETAIIAARIAEELGLDYNTVLNVKKAGLLHDVGKVALDVSEGGHALVGANLAKKWGYPDRIVNAIAAHHGEVEPMFIDASLVMIADAISAARPGARKENLENYIKRLENLEKIALSFENVEKAYAIQAGRELRVFVDSVKVSDEEAKIIAREIAKKIDEEINFPGQIKVTLIRETRIVETVR